MQIGLTGGIGCGKSTVSNLFRDRGFQSIDADKIVHDLLANDRGTIEAVVDLLGDEILSSEGDVDRSRVGSIVFADAEKLQGLERILHPRVRERWLGAVSQGGNWIVEIPLLFEKNLQNNVDLTVCVFCHPKTQVERLEKRGMNRDQALARINRQMPLSEKAELADYVLLNDGSLEFLDAQVDRLVLQLKTH